MTPYEINVVLHYYCRADDHPDIERNPPVWRPTIEAFLAQGLLRHGAGNNCYVLDERGTAYVDALLRTPLPVKTWVIPKAQAGKDE